MRKAAINGGAVQNLLNLGARALLGATWGGNGTIIFATEAASTGLEQISENGGATTVLTRPNRENGEEDHAWPAFLPGGQAVLFTITAAGGINNAAIAVLDLETGAQKILLRGGSAPRYLPSGHLVYAAAGSLRAVAFDLKRLEVSGAPVPVVSELVTRPDGAADFDVASDGTLVYVRGGLQEPARALTWIDREGREEPIQAPVRAYQYRGSRPMACAWRSTYGIRSATSGSGNLRAARSRDSRSSHHRIDFPYGPRMADGCCSLRPARNRGTYFRRPATGPEFRNS